MSDASILNRPARVLSHHLAELRTSGLSDETINAAGIYSESTYAKLRSDLNWSKMPKRIAPALVFPFHGPNGKNGFVQAKPDTPRVRKSDNKPIKYESTRDRGNEAYFPPGVVELIDNVDAELILTEGAKKALCSTQYGFPCIALPGVFGWKNADREALLPTLELVQWSGRRVFVVFDSDGATNEQVREGAARLAKLLVARGAVVRIAFPSADADEAGNAVKVGLDDFLIKHGPAGLRKLLNEAEEPGEVSSVSVRPKAKEIDPGDAAKRFLDGQCRDGVSKLRYWLSAWWYWSDGAYRPRSDYEVRASLVRWIDATWSCLTTSITSNVFELVKAHAVLSSRVESPTWLDNAPVIWHASDLLTTKTKIVHLPSLVATQTPSMIDSTPKLFTTSSLAFDFDPAAPAPSAWLDFLNQLWPNDPASIGLLQEWIGYLLTHDTRMQKIALIVGPKRSGKSTIGRMIHEIVGRENTCGPTLASLAQNFGLQPLLGKSGAIISDARLSGRTDTAIIIERLLSVSGEDTQTIDIKFAAQVNCKLPTRLMMLTNELPRLADASGAISSRFLVLRLTQSFYGREDHDLTNKLLAELPGILLWAIEGWRRLRERGRFVQPESSRELVEALDDLTSPVGMFVRERCNLAPDADVGRSRLYLAYCEWAKDRGRDHIEDEAGFGRALRAAVPAIGDSQPRDAEGKRTRVYTGIGLNP